MKGMFFCLAFALASYVAAAEAPKLEWKVAKGDKIVFTVQRSTSMETSGGQGEFKNSGTSEVEYKIEVADVSGGNLELKVGFGAVKAKGEGGRQGSSFEYDSSKPAGDDEIAKYLKETGGKTVTVTVKDGKIDKVEGFPEVAPQQPGQGNFRLFQARGIVGRTGIERDLPAILGLAVHGQALEAGKEYTVAPRERTDAAGEKGRGRGRGGFGFGEAPPRFKFTGTEKVDGKDAAAFALSAAPREGAGAGPQRDVKTEGKALFSLADGMVLKLESKSESKSEREMNGQTFKSSSSSKTTITRGAAAEAPKKSVTT